MVPQNSPGGLAIEFLMEKLIFEVSVINGHVNGLACVSTMCSCLSFCKDLFSLPWIALVRAKLVYSPNRGAAAARFLVLAGGGGGNDKCRRFATRRFLALSLSPNDCAGRAKYEGRIKPLRQNALCFFGGRVQSFKEDATSGELLVTNIWN